MLKNNQPLKGIASVKTLLFVLSLLLLVQTDFEGAHSNLFANAAKKGKKKSVSEQKKQSEMDIEKLGQKKLKEIEKMEKNAEDDVIVFSA